MNVQVTILDRVEFVRHNIHINRDELYVAIWMIGRDNRVYITFQDVRSQFARDTQGLQFGQEFVIGGTVREIYDVDESITPPAVLDWDRAPVRFVVIRPQVGGYKCESINQKKEEKRIKRLQKLGVM